MTPGTAGAELPPGWRVHTRREHAACWREGAPRLALSTPGTGDGQPEARLVSPNGGLTAMTVRPPCSPGCPLGAHPPAARRHEGAGGGARGRTAHLRHPPAPGPAQGPRTGAPPAASMTTCPLADGTQRRPFLTLRAQSRKAPMAGRRAAAGARRHRGQWDRRGLAGTLAGSNARISPVTVSPTPLTGPFAFQRFLVPPHPPTPHTCRGGWGGRAPGVEQLLLRAAERPLAGGGESAGGEAERSVPEDPGLCARFPRKHPLNSPTCTCNTHLKAEGSAGERGHRP